MKATTAPHPRIAVTSRPPSTPIQSDARAKAWNEEWDAQSAAYKAQREAQTELERKASLFTILMSASEMVSNKITDAGRRQVIYAGQLGVYLTLEEIDQLRAAVSKAREALL